MQWCRRPLSSISKWICHRFMNLDKQLHCCSDKSKKKWTECRIWCWYRVSIKFVNDFEMQNNQLASTPLSLMELSSWDSWIIRSLGSGHHCWDSYRTVKCMKVWLPPFFACHLFNTRWIDLFYLECVFWLFWY